MRKSIEEADRPVRKKSQQDKPFREQMTPDSLIAIVRKNVVGKPFRPLYTAKAIDEGQVFLNFFLGF